MYLANDVLFEQEIKKSRFLCYLKRTKTEQEARDFIASVKKEHPSATHHCTAMKIGNIHRSNDDGEPSGTAGRPMLDVLEGSECDQITAVVVRYFGGTLLGKGGLVRAYSSSVAKALEEASFVTPVTMGFYKMSCDFSLAGKAESFLRGIGENLEVSWMDKAVFTFFAREDPNPALARQFGGILQAELVNFQDVENVSHNVPHI